MERYKVRLFRKTKYKTSETVKMNSPVAIKPIMKKSKCQNFSQMYTTYYETTAKVDTGKTPWMKWA